MNVADVMTELADQLDTIDGLRVFDHVPKSVTPPAAVVAFPDVYTYDRTMGRGSDAMTIPVYVLIGNVHDRSARTLLGAYMDGTGDASIKAVLKAGTYTAFSTHRVRDVTVDVYQMAGVDLLGAQFNVDITGPGEN